MFLKGFGPNYYSKLNLIIYMYIQVHAFISENIHLYIELSITDIMSFIFRVLCTQASPQLSRKLILVTPQVFLSLGTK